MSLIIAGTGSRSLAEDRERFFTVLDNTISYFSQKKPSIVISGMAEGFDEVVARAAIKLKIPFHAYIPNKTYLEYYWGKKSVTGRNRFSIGEQILSYADKILYVCSTVYVNGVHANFIRNHAMVEAADVMVAYNITSSGTKHCVDYAKSRKVPIDVIG